MYPIDRYVLTIAEPFRLDLTASVLRRLSTNIVDVFTADGTYLRALGDVNDPVLVRVSKPQGGTLSVALEGDRAAHPRALDAVRRILGTDRTLRPFELAARRIPWLRPLARRMRGVKPPRYPTLWEACVNAVLFQQVSIHAASAILRRLIVALGSPIAFSDGVTMPLFPSAQTTLRASDTELRAAGLSANKIATLRRVGDALASGNVTEAMLDERSSEDAATVLRSIKGIGPWTATVILLRGLGRLDVFPRNDSGVAASLVFAGGSAHELERVLATLARQQGMLYYHLLLARLEARGEIAASHEA
jgi:DNA-3-methyladenine glycosylase II